MKVTVTYAIAKDARVLVSVGDEINPQTPVFQLSTKGKTEVIPVASILRIKEGLITRYLKKREGVKITAGEVLAEKKSLLSTSVIKSPVSGILKEIDLKKGTLTLVANVEKSHKITLPVQGRISKITSGHLEIEIEGKSFKGELGKGEETIGELLFLAGGKIGVLDIKDDVEGYVVACKTLLPETATKLEVLGAVGLISGKRVPETELPWVIVTEEIFDHIKSFTSKKIWLRPREKQVIVLE